MRFFVLARWQGISGASVGGIAEYDGDGRDDGCSQ